VTDYPVRTSPWQGGRGYAVALWTNAVRASGMMAALALSPWDAKYPSTKSDYETYFKNQPAELPRYGRPKRMSKSWFVSDVLADDG